MEEDGYDDVDAPFGFRENLSSLFLPDLDDTPKRSSSSNSFTNRTSANGVVGIKFTPSRSYHDVHTKKNNFFPGVSGSEWKSDLGLRRSSTSSGHSSDSGELIARSSSNGKYKPNVGSLRSLPLVVSGALIGTSTGFLTGDTDPLTLNLVAIGNEDDREDDIGIDNRVPTFNQDVIVPSVQNELHSEKPLNIEIGAAKDDNTCSDEKSEGGNRLSTDVEKDPHVSCGRGFDEVPIVRIIPDETVPAGQDEPSTKNEADESSRLLARGMGTRINRSLRDMTGLSDSQLQGDRPPVRTLSLNHLPIPRLSSQPHTFAHSTHSLQPRARSNTSVSRVKFTLERDDSSKSWVSSKSNTESEFDVAPSEASEGSLSYKSLEDMDPENASERLSPGDAEDCQSLLDEDAETVELRKGRQPEPDEEIPAPTGCLQRTWRRMCRYSAVVLPILSALLFLVDIGSDIRLAMVYKNDGLTDLFRVTMAFIIVPSVIMAGVDLYWFYMDRKRRREQETEEQRQRENKWFLAFRIIIGALSLGRVSRTFAHLYHYVKSLRKRPSSEGELDFHKHRSLEEKRDYYMLDFINAFTECVPQLLVQLVMWYKFDLEMIFERVFSLLSSWVSIAWAFAAYYRCNREALQDKENMSTIGFICVFLAQLFAFAARFSSIALFVTYFSYWVILVLGIHLLLMIAWTFYQDPPLLGIAASSFGKALFKFFFSYVQFVSFVNLKDSHEPAKVRMTLFYVVFYVENFVMSGLVFGHFCNVGLAADGNRVYNLMALPVGMGLHFWFTIVYYWCFHPSVNLRRSSHASQAYHVIKLSDVK